MNFEEKFYTLNKEFETFKKDVLNKEEIWRKKEEELLEKQVNMINDYLVNLPKLKYINEHTQKIIGYVMLFIFSLIMLVFKQDVFLSIIKIFTKTCE